jgi:hypothetical protein
MATSQKYSIFEYLAAHIASHYIDVFHTRRFRTEDADDRANRP